MSRVAPALIADLELDLEVFSGPFDLLLTLVLREEVDLLEVELADVVLSYLDFLEGRGELDLEAATEFLLLIAALLELKSRLMLPREEEELLDLEPGEAAEELLARMLEARRYRRAAEHLADLLADEDGHRFRAAPLPPALRRVTYDDAGAVYEPAQLGAAIGVLLRLPPPVSLAHLTVPRVSVAERLAHLRLLLRRGACSFDEAVRGADRVTVAVTLFALLELYKQGEATLAPGRAVRRHRDQHHGPRPRARGGGVVSALARTLEALLFLSSEPVSADDLVAAAECDAEELAAALRGAARAPTRPASAGSCCASSRAASRWPRTPETEPAARRLLARPRTPPLTPAQAETLAIVAYLQPVSRPEITRIRGVSADSASGTLLERGLVEEGGRSQFGAVLYRTTPLFLKLFGLASLDDLPDPSRAGTRRPTRRPTCATACSRRARRARAAATRPPTPPEDDDAHARRRPRGAHARRRRRPLGHLARVRRSRPVLARGRRAGGALSRRALHEDRRRRGARLRPRRRHGGPHRRRLRGGAQAGRLAPRRPRRGRDRARLAGPHPCPAPAARGAGPRGPRGAGRRLVRDRRPGAGRRQLIEGTGATLVGMSIVVDDLSDEARDGLGRLHALLRADAL